MKANEKAQLISSTIPLFTDLPQTEAENLTELAEIVSFRKGKFIARKGSNVDFLYFILSGNIKIAQANSKGKEITIALLGAGEHIGLASMFCENKRNTDVIALSRSELIQIKSQEFRDLLCKSPVLCFKLLESVSRRLYETSRHLAENQLCSLEQRLMIRLFELAEPDALAADYSLIVRDCPSHKELAALLGVSRESVTRSLINLESHGLIKADSGQILLNSRSLLNS